LLARALSYTGLDKWLIDQSRDSSIILGGESAGAMMMGPTLKHSEMEGDEDSASYVADGYKKEIIWDGLGLVSFVPVPHYQSGDYAVAIDQYIGQLDRDAISHREMTDEQAIVINGDEEEFLE
jgi:peptidase E